VRVDGKEEFVIYLAAVGKAEGGRTNDECQTTKGDTSEARRPPAQPANEGATNEAEH
jgi:hypothetical protein